MRRRGLDPGDIERRWIMSDNAQVFLIDIQSKSCEVSPLARYEKRAFHGVRSAPLEGDDAIRCESCRGISGMCGWMLI